MRARDTLHIVTAISNPIRWESRIKLARDAILDWIREPNVHVTVVECAHGGRDYHLADLAGEHVTHVPVRATTLVWSKENLLNLGIQRLPHDAKFIGTFDSDIHFRKAGWANEVMAALDIYPVIQPWSVAYDLGPNDEHLQTHRSFCRVFHDGGPVIPSGDKFWKFNGGPYEYPHSGYAWCYVREVLDRIGGLFEVGGMGSGDHHQALALVGAADRSMPAETNETYRQAVKRWEARALVHVNRKIGYAAQTIEHRWHGNKGEMTGGRQYVGRWDMFIAHRFDPNTDLKRNTYGVLEWSGHKPDLEREFDRYLRSRLEDANVIF